MENNFEADWEIIFKHFPKLTPTQITQIKQLGELYSDWNAQINVISRKDIDQIYIRHILHSLTIAKFIQFSDKSEIMDLGTGGGFPGIPLAILFPECTFTLIDGRSKKIMVVKEIIESLGLKNARGVHGRAEENKSKYDFIVSRAVAPMEKILGWTLKHIKTVQKNAFPNGWIFLKGGDLTAEFKEANATEFIDQIPLQVFFDIEFFDQKYLLYLPA